MKKMYLTVPSQMAEEAESGHPSGQPLPYREAMEETERKLFDEYTRACAGVRLLERLERTPMSLREQVRFWERVIDWLPRIFRLKHLLDQRVRARRMTQVEADSSLAWQLRHVFPPGYALTTLESELAKARCALAKARWQFFAQQHRGTVPVGGLLQRRKP